MGQIFQELEVSQEKKKINFMHMIYLSIVRKLHAKLGTQENDPAG